MGPLSGWQPRRRPLGGDGRGGVGAQVMSQLPAQAPRQPSSRNSELPLPSSCGSSRADPLFPAANPPPEQILAARHPRLLLPRSCPTPQVRADAPRSRHSLCTSIPAGLLCIPGQKELGAPPTPPNLSPAPALQHLPNPQQSEPGAQPSFSSTLSVGQPSSLARTPSPPRRWPGHASSPPHTAGTFQSFPMRLQLPAEPSMERGREAAGMRAVGAMLSAGRGRLMGAGCVGAQQGSWQPLNPAPPRFTPHRAASDNEANGSGAPAPRPQLSPPAPLPPGGQPRPHLPYHPLPPSFPPPVAGLHDLPFGSRSPQGGLRTSPLLPSQQRGRGRGAAQTKSRQRRGSRSAGALPRQRWQRRGGAEDTRPP